MRILTVHNFYQLQGGEDNIFAAEYDLLKSQGHEVERFEVHNDKVDHMNSLDLAKATLWNDSIYKELRLLFRRNKTQVAHFHNTFPLISPAAYHAAKAEGVAVVQTLHNFRLLCNNGLFFRDGHVCEDCLGKSIAWPGVIHACYRGDRIASAAVLAMVSLHSLLQTWTSKVDIFIAYSHFALSKFVQGGFPENKLEFKTNFLQIVPEIGSGSGQYALYVGRLAPEKGIGVMLKAWMQLGKKIPLKIVGDGPLASEVSEATRSIPGVEWLGQKTKAEVYEIMGNAAFLVISSEWYETFGLVGMEALAKGTPLVVSNIGAAAELVESDRNGVHFHPGDSEDLIAKVNQILDGEERLAHMRHEARAIFDEKYTAQDNYRRLIEIYQLACERSKESLVSS